MNAVTKYWIDKASEAIAKKTYRVWMHGHSLDLGVLLNYPKGNKLLSNFRWYREKQRNRHILNLLIETWAHWDKNRERFVYKHGVVE